MKTMTAVGLVIGLTFLTGCSVSVDGPAESPAATSDHDKRRADTSFDTVVGCPTGELVLDKEGQEVLVNQDCKKITIAARGVNVFAEHVDSVVVLVGADAVEAIVKSADSVVVDGAGSSVYWEEGTPAKVQARGIQSDAGPIASR